ncbi:MAG: hypothetical protein HY703_10465 [Gemmatimonadetes bacterium]|nr:hypothetical protein [Gemmatimonadota bacterium]
MNLRSPGFEVNDLAFLTRADYVWMNTNLGRQWTQPTRWYRRADLMLGAQQQYNFDGDLTDRQFHGWAGSQLANYWWINGMAIHRPETFDDRLTRGGPVVRRAANWFVAANLNTDWRKPVVLGFFPSYGWNAEGSHSSNLGMDLRLKPTSSFAVSLGPSFSRSGSTAQFVRRFDDGNASHFYSQRIVFADLVQRTLAMDTRLSATFSPTLTLEVFLQPFVASADYRNFKEFAAPRRLAKNRYDAAQLRAISSAEGRDSAYVLDPDRDPATRNFSFANPDFNFRSLRGNAVLRWEYRPGSTLYLVWQQERSGSEPLGDFDFSRDAAAVFREKPNNIFLIKATYWSGK